MAGIMPALILGANGTSLHTPIYDRHNMAKA